MRVFTVLLILLLLVVGLSPAFGQYFSKPGEVKWEAVQSSYHAADMVVGPSAKVVPDAAASDGRAVAALVGQGKAGHILKGGWVRCQPDAAYEIAFRMRLEMNVISPPELNTPLLLGQPDKDGLTCSYLSWPLRLEAVYRSQAEAVAEEKVVGWTFVPLENPPGVTTDKVRIERPVYCEGDEPGIVTTYHDYVLRIERPPSGVLGFRVYWYGRAYCSAWIDTVQVRELPLPAEAEQLKAVGPPPALTIHHDQPRTLVVQGTYSWVYRAPELVGGACDATWAFPADAATLERYDVIVLVDTFLAGLSPRQRMLLAAYVKAGGGVLILGGPSSYGKSWVHVSPLLADLLPVSTAGLWDLRNTSGRGMALSAEDERFRALQWKARPLVYYFHEATPKPDAQVWLTLQEAGGKADAELPALVVRSYGKGLVAAFLFTPFGKQEGKDVPFWAWKDWPRLLNITINAARGRRGEEGIAPPGYQPPAVQLLPRLPAPAPRKILPYPLPITTPGKSVEILRVWPHQICFRPGARASGTITLGNGTREPARVTLAVSLLSGLDEVRQLTRQTFTMPAGTVKEVPVSWNAGRREFGQELRAELYAADGALRSRKSDCFTVGWNNYRLGQCSLIRPWTWEPDPRVMPGITPEDRWNIWIPGVRERYCTVTEYFFWAPDDFGNLTPDEDTWFSGQAMYLISQADIHAVINAAHRQGIAVVTYGKKWMSVSGVQTGRDGVELVREHPEWCEWMPNGHPKWWFDASRYTWSFDQWRDLVQRSGKGDIGGVAVNCAPEDCVRFGSEEIVRSARKYGWDGVRFDDHFTLDSVFDGGLGFDGETTERAQDYEALTARNVKLSESIFRKADSHFLVGYNYAKSYTGWGVRQPAAFVETCKHGQFVMLEHTQWWQGRRWDQIISLLALENHRVHRLGGVPGMVSFNGGRWETAINYASQGHYYNLPDGPDVARYTYFMLRYGELLYDEKTQFVEDADTVAQVTPAEKALYRDFTYRRPLSANRQQLIVNLINNPGADSVSATKPPAPVEQVRVACAVPDGWTVDKVFCLNPDGDTPCEQIAYSVDEGGVHLNVPKLEVWNIIVVELKKK